MNISSNLLKTIKKQYLSELTDVYDDREALALLDRLIEHFFGLSRTGQALNPGYRLNESEILKLHFAVKELKKEKPVQYIIGESEFTGLTLKVTPHVLIPRPETEELIEKIVSVYQDKPRPAILDIGTGSGCIALALKSRLPESKVTAIDVSSEALTIAKENSRINQLEISFLQINILNKQQTDQLERFDLIVSNPPYVTESDRSRMKNNVVDYEPHLALFVSDNDPLLYYRAIAGFAQTHLNPAGQLWFEINENFGKEVISLLTENNFHNPKLHHDINGKQRFVSAGL